MKSTRDSDFETKDTQVMWTTKAKGAPNLQLSSHLSDSRGHKEVFQLLVSHHAGICLLSAAGPFLCPAQSPHTWPCSCVSRPRCLRASVGLVVEGTGERLAYRRRDAWVFILSVSALHRVFWKWLISQRFCLWFTVGPTPWALASPSLFVPSVPEGVQGFCSC